VISDDSESEEKEEKFAIQDESDDDWSLSKKKKG
jgi:hypothetical protein